jgi:hypothetical protein
LFVSLSSSPRYPWTYAYIGVVENIAVNADTVKFD